MKQKKRPPGPPTKVAASSKRSEAARAAPRARTFALGAILLLLATLPYANTLQNDFAFDDIGIIAENPIIRDLANVGKIFATNYWSRGGARAAADIDPGLYRPFTILSYAVDYRFWKLDPKGYHLVNAALHAGATIVLFVVALRLLTSPMAAVAAAAIFAVHPVHTEAVTGVVGRAEVLATLFFLLAFWFLRAERFAEAGVFSPRGAASAGAAATFYLLGLFSKETAVTLPALLMVDDWLRGEDFAAPDKKKSITKLPVRTMVARYAALAVAAVIYFAFRNHAVTGRGNIWAGFAGVSTGERVLTASRVLMEYLGLLIFPRTLLAAYWKADVSIAESPLEPLVLLSLGLWAAIGLVAYYAWRKDRALLFSLAWFFITILPVSNIFFPIGVAKAERILYLPSAGFCLFAGWLYARLEKTVRIRWLALIPLVAVVLALAVRTYRRNADWKDDLGLALATLKVSPTVPIMNNIAAVEYSNRGDQERAIPMLEEAVRQRPDSPMFRSNLGAAYARKGMIEAAIEQYREAIKLNPDDAGAHSNLGAAYFSKNQIDEAMKEFNTAVRINPDSAEAHNNLGGAYSSKGQLDQAIEQYKEALKLKPDYPDARNNLDQALRQKGPAKAGPR